MDFHASAMRDISEQKGAIPGETGMTTAFDVARCLIRLGYTPQDPEDSDCLCPLRVQKLLYYVQGWSLALRGRPMFGERIEAWKFGPVVPEVYHRFKPYGYAVINPEDIGEPENLTAPDRAFIESVWSEYKAYSATKLREMTHAESPWNEARIGLSPDARSSNAISQESLRIFFEKQAEQHKGALNVFDLQEVWGAHEEMERGAGRSLKDIMAGLKR